MNCYQCGAQNREGAAFCKRCGSPLGVPAVPPGQQRVQSPPQSATACCPACGRQIRSGAAFCPYCGVSFQKAGSAGRDPWLGLRIVLAVLCLGMVIFGALTIPGKIRERLDGAAAPAGQTTPGTPAGPGGAGQTAQDPAAADLAAQYAQIDAMLENGELDAAEPTGYVHDGYEWFCDDAGWVEVTENGGEAP